MRAASWIVVFALALSVSPAFAQDPITQARSIFEQAEADHEAGRYQLAADGFAHAYELMRGHPRQAFVLYNWAASLAELPGREGEAEQRYAQFLRDVNPNDPQAADFTSRAQHDLQEMHARRRHDAAHEPPWLGVAVGGAGLAAVLGGAITGALVLAHDDQLGSVCNGLSCPTTARGLAGERADLALATDVLMISGLVLSAAGVALALWTELTASSGSSVAAIPACNAYGCAVVAAGRF